jgi:hypothetical protein
MPSNKYLYHFIPEKFEYLTKTKTVPHKEFKLKTSYLLNIIHEIILKYYFTSRNYIDIDPEEEIKFNLWSLILRRKYGMNYHLYLDYLVQNGFITMVSNYYVGKKAKTYKLNFFDFNTIKDVKTVDNILIKKYSKEYLIEAITERDTGPIDPVMKKRLAEDLYHIKINYEKSLKLLNDQKSKGDIEINKYFKNKHSVECIKNNHLFFVFDEYGRFHSNFTILKKEIRQNFLKIDNDEVVEIDIRNSQPLFLALLLQEEMDPTDPEINNYIWLVREGLFYDYFLSHNSNLTRSDVKLLTYKVLFGHNGINSVENKIFKTVFPKIYEYILDFKKVNGNYKFLAHTLQKMESDFMFGKVVKELYDTIPDIKLFTVHDSVTVPVKYEKQALEIFNRHLKELF